MSLPAAYLGVVVIWSTTPLAIQWSGDQVNFLFGLTARMVIGLGVILVLLALWGEGLRWHRRAVAAYLVAGVTIVVVMVSVYWAAQQIPSGWISVLFGVAPLITGVMSRWWLGTPPLSNRQYAGLITALAGLTVIFGGDLRLGWSAYLGLLAVLFGATVHAAGAVALKRINVDLPALVQTGGGLLVAVPLLLALWWLADGGWPASIPPRSAASILYLAIGGSVVGFSLYYYVLRRCDAVRVALITLITPVVALGLGRLFNQELITWQVGIGSGLIVGGLALFESANFGRRDVAPTKCAPEGS